MTYAYNGNRRRARQEDEMTVTYKADGDRYIVMMGNDRIGFLRKDIRGSWHATDSAMDQSMVFATRTAASKWLQHRATELED
jgi:hypothetical protein